MTPVLMDSIPTLLRAYRSPARPSRGGFKPPSAVSATLPEAASSRHRVLWRHEAPKIVADAPPPLFPNLQSAIYNLKSSLPPLPTCPTKWGEPNRCSPAHTLTLAKIELLCYKWKRSQEESARQPNRLLA